MSPRRARRRFFVFALVLSVVAPAALRAQTCGDSDGSGSVTVTDGVNVLRQAAGLSSACSSNTAVCDADGGGSVSVTDGVNVLRHAAGLDATLSCPGGDVARFAGTYRGTYSGDDQGTFDVSIASDGSIEGVAYSTIFDEDYGVTGQVTQDGNVTFTVGVVDDTATFSGTIDDEGRVTGQWSNSSEDSSGSFEGQRSRRGRRGPPS